MEFWGVEVKPGKPLKVSVEDDKVIHLSQASLGEIKKDKGNESTPLFVNINGQKLVLGHLSAENFPQQAFDLVFEKEFELSHNCKSGSVYFTGYTSEIPEEREEFYDSEDSESEDELAVIPAENGKAEPKVESAKPAAAKANASKPQPKKETKAMEIDEDDEDDEDSDDEDGEADEDEGDDSEDEDESDDEEDEETPKKAEVGKKRAPESATKTPVPAKKAKASTPQKTDGKKGGHTATPHPAKQAGKAPATPKSGGPFSCGSCNKSFNSEGGLQSHNKAKHSGK